MYTDFKKGKNKKTIKKIIKAKMTDWLKTIDDEILRKRVEDNLIVTGGCIASMLLGEKVKDFDVYLRTKEVTMELANYYVDKFNAQNKGRKNKVGFCGEAFVLDCDDKDQVEEVKKKYTEQAGHMLNLTPGRVKIVVPSDGVAADNSQGQEVLDEPFEDVYDVITDADQIPEDAFEDGDVKYKPVFLSSNAITLSNKIQIVIRFYGNPEEIHENYDFVHCTNYYDSKLDRLELKQEALQSLLSRELKYQGSKYPLCSVIRTRKFLKRGWQINAGQYLKMCFQISQLDLTDLNVLEDQLVGVDSVYFMNVIRQLQKKQETNPEWTISDTYLATIIDKIF